MTTIGRAALDVEANTDPARRSIRGFGGRIGSILGGAAKAGAIALGAALAGTAVAATKAVFSTAKFGDTVAKAAGKAAVGVEQLQELEFAFGEAGIQAQDTRNALQRFNRRIGEAADGTGTATDAVETLGLKLRDANGEVRATGDVLDDALPALAAIEEDSRRAALAGDLFGQRQGPELAAALSKGVEGIEEARQRAQDLGIVMDEEATRAAERFTDEWGRLTGSVQGSIRNGFAPLVELLADDVLPVITERIQPALRGFSTGLENLIGAFREDGLAGAIDIILTTLGSLFDEAGNAEGILGGVGEFFKDMAGEIVDAAPDILDAIQTALVGAVEFVAENIGDIVGRMVEFRSTLLDAAIRAFEGLLDAVGDILPDVIDALVDGLSTLIDAVIGSAPDILAAGIEALLQLVDAVVDVIPDVLDAIVDLLDQLLSALLDAVPDLLEAGIKLLEGLIEGLVQVLPQVVRFVVELIPVFVDTVVRLLPQIVDAGIRILLALIEGIVAVLPQLIGVIATQLIPTVVVELLKLGPKLLGVGVDVMLRLLEGLAGAVTNNIIPFLVELPGRLIGAIPNLFRAFISIGKDIVRGIAEGIRSFGGFIVDALLRILPGPLESAVRRVLGISSPSKLFAEFGRDIVLGLVQGIEEEERSVEQQLRHLSDTVASGLAGTEAGGISAGIDEAALRRIGEAAAPQGATQIINQNVTVQEVAGSPTATARSVSERLARGVF